MKAYVFSKRLFDKHMADNGITDSNIPQFAAVVSIGEPNKSDHYFKEASNVLNIDFWDVNGYDVEGIKGCTDEEAKIIYNFLIDNIGKTFYIHCHAGVSRSQAVAEFLRDCYGYEIERVVPYGAHSNTHLLTLLKRQYYKRELSENL